MSSPVVVIEKVEYHSHADLSELLHKLIHIVQNQRTIMSAIDDLKTEVADLKVKVDAEQAQIQTLLDNDTQTIAALNEQITVLTGELANGATAAQIAEVVTEIQAIKADIESTVADVPPPVV